ncbi:MAG TPA: hypothetical protein PLU33_03570 [Treponemataceae bacterium]|nr:hypothetical protein [Spirochaetaceae bacterium]HOE07385.1 hypothetical protein [Treponemataceae bacterium]HOS29842.1 hypothetical protein [Treponemataceae bacterium]HQL04190.1 hypothetical protein [Treponemataceae bacterium]
MNTTQTKQELKPLASYSIFKAYITVPFHWSSLKMLLKYLRTVIFDFFLLQFSVKFGWRKIPVLSVDHELDARVPFVPGKVGVYLDFINFWIRPMSFLIERFGVKKAVPYCTEYLRVIEECYCQAARMYKFRMSTTRRPPVGKNKHFRMIHIMDPHYLCVPSLHVTIVSLAYNFYRKVFDELDLPQEEKDFYNKELYEGALAITETVLYVKQHSVNCIPAALYMCLYVLKDTFSIEGAIKFIDDLFVSSSDIAGEDKKSIHEYIGFFFERLLLEGCNEDDWVIPVQRWIISYIPFN